MQKGSPAKRSTVAEGPISDFHQVIQTTSADDWQRRALALKQLVDLIPTGTGYTEKKSWYNNPAVLRHLANPVAVLLKDARSTVVKRVCESMTVLFNKCQSNGRYLFKDIMPTILSVHGQTVQVIRQAVQNMVVDAIPEVPCKMVMPLWMERLKVDKSRTVREACSLYLGHALKSWTESGYLTQDIWLQVGSIFVRTVRDPSPNVRINAKSALDWIRVSQPTYWEILISDLEGAAAKDIKLQRWLTSLGQDGSEGDDLSLISKGSYNSETRFAIAQARSSPVPRLPPNRRPVQEQDKLETMRSLEVRPQDSNVPASIGVSVESEETSTASRAKRIGGGGGLGPPKRPTAPFQKAMESPAAQKKAPRPRSGTPPRHPSPTVHKLVVGGHLDPIEGRSSSNSDDKVFLDDDGTPQRKTAVKSTALPADLSQTLTMGPGENVLTETKASKRQETSPSEELDCTDSSQTESQFIASMEELKMHASKRRNRNSLLMKARFRVSSADDYDEPNVDSLPEELTKPAMKAPEHMLIAIRLLRAHKEHVDNIMETLKEEMDKLRDFDRLLEEPGRPNEEEVLDYFESVGLYLDQRTEAVSLLQREMDRISRGQPPS